MKVIPKVVYVAPKERTRTRHLLSPSKKVKTTMCHSVAEGVRCSFGMTCKYAHSVSELRSRKVNPRYRSQPRWEYNYINSPTYFCYHGDVCSFLHLDEDIDEVTESLLRNHHALSLMLSDSYNHQSNQTTSLCDSMTSVDSSGLNFSPRRTSTPRRIHFQNNQRWLLISCVQNQIILYAGV